MGRAEPRSATTPVAPTHRFERVHTIHKRQYTEPLAVSPFFFRSALCNYVKNSNTITLGPIGRTLQERGTPPVPPTPPDTKMGWLATLILVLSTTTVATSASAITAPPASPTDEVTKKTCKNALVAA